MLSVCTWILRIVGEVVLKYNACPHSENVKGFDDRQGSRRTQATQAMQKQAPIDHG
jgi:uncharacterized lipoprotein YddW (UPF0748 family)